MEKYNREIILNDDKLREYAAKKDELVKQGRELSKKQEELVKQHEKITNEIRKTVDKVTKLKLDKIIPRTQVVAKDMLSEFEIPISTELKDGKLVLLVEDVIEEFKVRFNKYDKWSTPTPPKKK